MLFSEEGTINNHIKDEVSLNDLKSGIIAKNVEVFMCTSIIDAGVSLKVEKDVDCYVIANHREDIINPIDLIQLCARVRDNTNYSMCLKVLGVWKELISDTKLSFDAIRNVKSNVRRINLMSDAYDSYEYIKKEDYVKLLDNYDIELSLHTKPLDTMVSTKKKASKYDIVTNLHLNCLECVDVVSHTQNNIYGDNTELYDVLIGEEVIEGVTKTEQERIVSDLVKATNYYIPFKLFVWMGRWDNTAYNKYLMIKDYYKDDVHFTKAVDILIDIHKSGNASKLPVSILENLQDEPKKCYKFLVDKLFKKVKSWKGRKNITLTPLDEIDNDIIAFITYIGRRGNAGNQFPCIEEKIRSAQ